VPASVKTKPLELRLISSIPKFRSRRVRERLTVEVGTRSLFAAALKVPASAAATNITTSLASYLTSQSKPFPRIGHQFGGAPGTLNSQTISRINSLHNEAVSAAMKDSRRYCNVKNCKPHHDLILILSTNQRGIEHVVTATALGRYPRSFALD
jgi:hypothetical protein